MPEVKTKKVGRWYFGGLASAGAACCTHPLDLLKVYIKSHLLAFTLVIVLASPVQSICKLVQQYVPSGEILLLL